MPPKSSIYKKSRRLGISLIGNNSEFTKWKARVTPPGQHGNAPIRRRNKSVYSQQLLEKQKLAFMYGVSDTQMRRFFKKAKGMSGVLSLNFLIILESRLDNLVFRMGFAPTRRSARQLVVHGHVKVDGKKLDIPSALIKINQEISIKSPNLPLVNLLNEEKKLPFVEVDVDAKKGTLLRVPLRSELSPQINELYVVEWFNRLA